MSETQPAAESAHPDEPEVVEHESGEEAAGDPLEGAETDPDAGDGDPGDELGDEQLRRQTIVTRDERAVEMQKRLGQLDNEAVRHYNRLGEIMGEDVEGLERCPLCPPNIPGWRFPVAPTDDVIGRVRVVIGLPDLSNFAPSSTERQCDDCRGLGRVRTGSLIAKFESSQCDACKGKGWIVTRPRLHAVDDPDAPVVNEDGSVDYPDDGVRRDMFGTPETDPDFEKMPSARARPVDYWRTNHAG